MKRSSKIAYCFFKIAGVLMAFFGTTLLYELIFLSPSNDRLAISLIILLLLFCFYFLIYRLTEIEYDEEKIKILNTEKTYHWDEVKQVIKIPFCTPPLYRISFKNNEQPILLVMSMNNISIGIYSWDFTGFYQLANDKTT